VLDAGFLWFFVLKVGVVMVVVMVMRELGRSERLFLVFSIGDEGSYLISSGGSMIDLQVMIKLQLAELITEYLIKY
jgi:hypothetical protein